MGMPNQLRLLNHQAKMRRLDRAMIVAEMYCKGMNQRDIAEKIGVSRDTVRKALDTARDVWLERLGDSIERHRAEQLAKIDRLEATAWDGFERSQRATKERIKESGEHPKSVLKKKTNAGDAKFLQVISKQIEMRIRLLGLDKPEATGVDSTGFLEVVISTRAEAAKMLPYMDFAKEVDGEVTGSSERPADDLDN